jgi:menaquinone-dependent protoporphyrinogen oxidase
MNPRILVLYASTHGHTGRIADRIGATLERTGVHARVCDVAQSGAAIDLDQFDGVIAGASIHAGHHQHDMVAWLRRHHERLSAMPSAFFSVSLTAVDETDEARAAVRDLIAELVEATGWTPRETVAFGGALQFKEYNLPTRVLMRLIARRHDPHVDVHQDTDYTDWAAVERFAEAFAASLDASEVPS